MAWWSLDPRAIFEFECVRISRRLARTIRSGKFHGHVRPRFRRRDSRLCHHRRPPGRHLAHAVDDRRLHANCTGSATPTASKSGTTGKLAGGTYGVAIGGLFAAESMFYRVRDASKVAVVSLLAHLQARGYSSATFNSGRRTPAGSARS